MEKTNIRKELLISLKLMIENIEELPQEIMFSPINHYDLASALLLMYQLLILQDMEETEST